MQREKHLTAQGGLGHPDCKWGLRPEVSLTSQGFSSKACRQGQESATTQRCLFLFFGVGHQTQGLVHATQLLNHRATHPTPSKSL